MGEQYAQNDLWSMASGPNGYSLAWSYTHTHTNLICIILLLHVVSSYFITCISMIYEAHKLFLKVILEMQEDCVCEWENVQIR